MNTSFFTRYSGGNNAELIYKGKYTRIYRGYDSSELRPVAIKVMRKELTIRSIPRNFGYLSRLLHPNICRCYDVNVHESVNQFGEMERTETLVLEYASGGDILTYTKRYPEFRKKLLTDVLFGLEYLHDNNQVHGNINGTQILIKETAEGPQAVISCIDINRPRVHAAYPDYYAPEQLMPKAYTEYDHRADLWAWGCLLYEVYTGERLFYTEEQPMRVDELLWKMGAEPYELAAIPAAMREYAANCLVSNPERRIGTASQLLEMIKADDARREEEVQKDTEQHLALSAVADDMPVARKGQTMKSTNKKDQPKGLVNFFNSFRRF